MMTSSSTATRSPFSAGEGKKESTFHSESAFLLLLLRRRGSLAANVVPTGDLCGNFSKVCHES